MLRDPRLKRSRAEAAASFRGMEIGRVENAGYTSSGSGPATLTVLSWPCFLSLVAATRGWDWGMGLAGAAAGGPRPGEVYPT